MLPLTELEAALGVAVPGSISYVQGQPLPNINRTGRITCGYGVVPSEDGTPQPPLLEASLSSYADATSASDRVEATVAQQLTAGDQRQDVQVGDLPSVVTIGVSAALLVLADGTRTCSLTLLTGVVPPEQVPSALVAVAQKVLAPSR